MNPLQCLQAIILAQIVSGAVWPPARAAETRQVDDNPSPASTFDTRGVVLVPEDLSPADWPERAAGAGLTTISLHHGASPKVAVDFIESPAGREFLARCARLRLQVGSQWKRPAVKLPWRPDVLEANARTYAQLGLRHVTTFAVWIDADYVKRFGEPVAIQEYGETLRRQPSMKGDSAGDFELNRVKWPDGWESWRRIVARLHDAGLGAIFHTFAFFIDKGSRYVTPVPDQRLDAFRSFTLAADVSAEARTASASPSLPRGTMPAWPRACWWRRTPAGSRAMPPGRGWRSVSSRC